MSSNYPPFGNASARPCQRCGRPLPPNEAYCTTCGFMNAPAPPPNNAVGPSPSGTAWSGATPPQSFGSGQMGGQQWGQPSQPSQPPIQPAQSNPFANSAFPQQPFGSPNAPVTNTNPFSGSPNQQSPTTNPFFGTPGQSGVGNGFGASASQQPFYPPQSSQSTTGTFQNGNQNGNMNGFAPSSPSQQNGFGPPPQQQNGFGFPPPQQNGFASSSPQQSGFSSSTMNGFAPQQQQNSFGLSPQQQNGNMNSFGTSPQQQSGFTPSGFGQQPTTGGFTPPPNMNSFQNSGQNGGFTQTPPMHDYQPESPPQPPEQKRRPKVGVIITAIVLLVLLVGGGLGGYYYVKHHSATVIPQVTPTMAPTPTPTGKVLFTDTFTNNDSGWDLTTKPGEYSVKIGGGTMAIEDDANKLLWEVVPGNRNFSDFYLTVDATLSKGTQGNGYGLYIRGSLNQNAEIVTYYRFELYGDSSFAIFKGSVDATGISKSTLLVNYAIATAIQKQGKVNHLAINAKGSILSFYVNGQVIKIVTDNTYNTGSIAFFVSNLPHTTPGAQVTFANLAIYPPQVK